jgi:hypothetical protein
MKKNIFYADKMDVDQAETPYYSVNRGRSRNSITNTTHKIKRRIVIDEKNNNYIGQDIFQLFNFSSLTYGDQLRILKYIEATATLTVDDNDVLNGPAEITGMAEYDQKLSPFQVQSSFVDNKPDGDCYFILKDGTTGQTLFFDQVKITNGVPVVSLIISYEFIILSFNKYFSQTYPFDTDSRLGSQILNYIDEYNTFIKVDKLLELIPALDITGNWTDKLLAAEKICTDVDYHL